MNLDIGALRTFVTAADIGGFGKAAERLHRTPGAVSLQMKTLEARVARPLFAKVGRGSQLTAFGETLLTHARRVLAAHDEAVLALTGLQASGDLRIGLPQDLADVWLAPALGRFSRAFPAMRLEVKIARSTELSAALDDGALDVAVIFERATSKSPASSLFEVDWWSAPDFGLIVGEPAPLLLLEAPCRFRDAALAALDRAEIPWRIALTSASVSALWAAAAAGLGITARTGISVPSRLIRATRLALPQLETVALVVRNRQDPAAERLADVVRETIRHRGG